MQTPTTGAFAALLALAIARSLPLRLPRGESFSPDIAVVLVGIVAIGTWQIVLISMIVDIFNLVFSGAGKSWSGSVLRLRASLSRAGTITLAGLVFMAIPQHVPLLLQVLAAGIAAATIEYVRVAGDPAWRRLQWRYFLAEEQPILSVMLMHVAVGAALADVSDLLGAWSAPVALVIAQILQGGIMLLLEIRRAYEQTILVVARAIDLGTGSPEGLAQRTSDLAVEIAREHGLPIPELQDLSKAALLWRLSRVGLGGNEDLPGSARSANTLHDTAELLKRVRFLESSARILESAAEYLRDGAHSSSSEYDAARILCQAIEKVGMESSGAP